MGGLQTDAWPYTACRNPLYFGLLFIGAPGFAVAFNSAWIAVAGLPLWLYSLIASLSQRRRDCLPRSSARSMPRTLRECDAGCFLKRHLEARNRQSSDATGNEHDT